VTYNHGTIHEIVTVLKQVSVAYKAETYIVGGAVRDLIGLRMPTDIDVITSAKASELAPIIAKRIYGASARQIPAPFQLWRVKTDTMDIDIVGGVENIEDDYKKRNFTINAIYYDVRKDMFVDPSGSGFKDLHNHIIREVSTETFKGERDDNIFIALRLSAEIGFNIDTKTLHSMALAIKEKGANLKLSKRARKEIQRSQLGFFKDKVRTIASYIGLGNFLDVYKPAEALGHDSLRMIIAKYKSKKTTERGNVVYEYGEEDKKARVSKKAKHVRNVFKNIDKVVAKFNKDMKSDDMYTKMTALAVAMIYYTYERVGSRDNIGTGITSLKKKHIKISGNKTKLNYIGKSHVKQSKEINNAQVTRLISNLLKNKKPNDYLFNYSVGDEKLDIFATDVNEWLKSFGITAKDLRAHAANSLLIDRLKKAPKPGKGLSDNEKEIFYKKELKEAIDGVAKEIGHTPGVCKSSYIDPKIIKEYEKTGKVLQISKGSYSTIPKIMLFKYSNDIDPVESYVERNGLGSDQSKKIRAKINNQDVDIDPEMEHIEDVIKAVELIKELAPDTFKGVLMLVPASKSKYPVSGDAFGFVLSHEPFIVYLNPEKIKNAIDSGMDTRELYAQIAGVIKHESEHSKGENSESGPYREQENMVEKILDKKQSLRFNLNKQAEKKDYKREEYEDVFSALGKHADKKNIIPASREIIKSLHLGSDEDRMSTNSALLALGFLIEHGENPYRAEWYVRKAFNIKDNLKFNMAVELYQLLNTYINKDNANNSTSAEDMKEYARLGLWADPSQTGNLGNEVDPKWEARPSISPDNWHGYFPQRNSINY